MVQLFKPNLAIIQEEAKKSREEEEARKKANFEGGDLNYYNLQLGDNVFRLLPPTNSRGILHKKVSTHFFNRSMFKSIKPIKCVASMFPDVPGAKCPICDTAEKIKAKMPQLNLNTWSKPADHYYYQVLPRGQLKEGEKIGARLMKVTGKIKNWIILQQEDILKQGIDMTSLEAGLDVKITREDKDVMRKGKKEKMTNYTPTIWSLLGPQPLHPDKAVVDAVVASMIDPEKIWGMPKDEKMAEAAQAASTIYTHYMNAGNDEATSIGTKKEETDSSNDDSEGEHDDSDDHEDDVETKPASKEQAAAAEKAVSQITQLAAQATQTEAKKEAPKTEVKTEVKSKQESLPIVNQSTKPASPHTNGSGSPTDKPVCWGGAAPRPGTDARGYSDEDENCLMCAHELTCIDKSKEAKVA